MDCKEQGVVGRMIGYYSVGMGIGMHCTPALRGTSKFGPLVQAVRLPFSIVATGR
jgi:hypothetical protein